MAYEADLEAWCRERAVRDGGYLLKWVSPGNKGVPDRILLLPCFVAFIEFKALSGKLSALQQVWYDRLTKMGHNVYIVRTKDQFREILIDADQKKRNT